jgi:hypothetical protein
MTSPEEPRETGVPDIVRAWPLGVTVLSATITGIGFGVTV